MSSPYVLRCNVNICQDLLKLRRIMYMCAVYTHLDTSHNFMIQNIEFSESS